MELKRVFPLVLAALVLQITKTDCKPELPIINEDPPVVQRPQDFAEPECVGSLIATPKVTSYKNNISEDPKSHCSKHLSETDSYSLNFSFCRKEGKTLDANISASFAPSGESNIEVQYKVIQKHFNQKFPKSRFIIKDGLLTSNDKVIAKNLGNTSEVASPCECKTLCSEISFCVTLSIAPQKKGRNFDCTVANSPIHDLSLISEKGALTLAKESSFTLHFDQVGTFYKILQESAAPYDENQHRCKIEPNGNLLMFKSPEEVHGFRAYIGVRFGTRSSGNSWFHIALFKVPGTDNYVWDDEEKTPFDISTYGSALVFGPGKLPEKNLTVMYYHDRFEIITKPTSWPACQIRPF